jgi:hypothetical protein
MEAIMAEMMNQDMQKRLSREAEGHVGFNNNSKSFSSSMLKSGRSGRKDQFPPYTLYGEWKSF